MRRRLGTTIQLPDGALSRGTIARGGRTLADDPLNTRLTAATLEAYFTAANVVPVRLLDAPECTMRVDPTADRLELWTPLNGPEPDVRSLHRVMLRRERIADRDWHVLAVDSRNAHVEAYSLIAAIVDDLAAGLPFYSATARSLAAYRELLLVRGRLSEEKVLGLIGELLVFEHLLGSIDESTAIDAWVGPQAEEHDFVLVDLDVEVKTTLNERRSHVIGSETQLQRSPGRPLWLISIQLTRGGAASSGDTLGDVITRVSSFLTTGLTSMNARLEHIGWRAEEADLYPEKYLPRSRPKGYLVDERFPAITRSSLQRSIPSPELVGHVTYRVDVSDLDFGVPPGPLSNFVDSEQQ